MFLIFFLIKLLSNIWGISNFLISDFEGRVKPTILSTGIPVSTYIKDAVNEKMIPDGLCRPEDIPSAEIPGTIKAAIQKFTNNDKKTVLYIADEDTMYSYVKADGAKYTCEDAIMDYGNREYENISDDAYVVESRCKGVQDK